MRTGIICFTDKGCKAALRAARLYGGVPVWYCRKNEDHSLPDGAERWQGSLTEWVREHFYTSDLLIFVGAAGIAVRAVAPFLRSKMTDPAVLCVDEGEQFVIPLLSGHIGGANEQAAALARHLGAQPVITTATDINRVFAVDVFARRNGLAISDMKLAKLISADLLEGKQVLMESDFPVTGTVPEGIRLAGPGLTGADDACGKTVCETENVSPYRIGISVKTASSRENAGKTLHLTPGILTVGVGCRKGKEPDDMIRFIHSLLQEHGLSGGAVARIASIDLKAEEPAIQALAEHYGVPLQTFSADELQALQGSFTASAFVETQVGVDNVCERSAVLGSGGGRLLVRKTARDGMTAAVAVEEWTGSFEGNTD